HGSPMEHDKVFCAVACSFCAHPRTPHSFPTRRSSDLHALDALTPREATIMAMRFGLYDGNPHTLDEIGRALGLTRERIRQLEKQSLSKLRHPSRAQPLLDFAS